MALYEFLCPACGTRTERRMPMTDILQLVPCSKCGEQAKRIVGNFAIVGRSEAAFEDGAPPWDDAGGAGLDSGDAGHSHDFGHGHSHGPGGHTH